MSFHAKALELYTLAYQHVQEISEDETEEVRLTVAAPVVTIGTFQTYSNLTICHLSPPKLVVPQRAAPEEARQSR